MKLVRIQGDGVAYPRKCACCLQPSTGTLQVSKEDLKRLALAAMVGSDSAILAQRLRSRRALDVPYCAACIKHVTWARMGGWVGLALTVVVNSFFAALAGGGLYLLLSVAAEDAASAPRPEVVVGGCVAVGLAIAASKLRFKPADLDRSHARGAKDAVEIARFTEDAIVLRCHNDQFARELLQANPGSAETRAA